MHGGEDELLAVELKRRHERDRVALELEHGRRPLPQVPHPHRACSHSRHLFISRSETSNEGNATHHRLSPWPTFRHGAACTSPCPCARSAHSSARWLAGARRRARPDQTLKWPRQHQSTVSCDHCKRQLTIAQNDVVVAKVHGRGVARHGELVQHLVVGPVPHLHHSGLLLGRYTTHRERVTRHTLKPGLRRDCAVYRWPCARRRGPRRSGPGGVRRWREAGG